MSEGNNKTIVVTGATSGLGLALVSQLKDAGYNAILTGRNGEKVTMLAAELGVPGYVLDVADGQSIDTVCKQIEDEQGQVWGLVNNAGIWLEGDFENYTPEEIRAVMETNTTGTMMMTHQLLPGMLARKRGTIVNVISTGALYTRKIISVYCASKWAIRGFTGALEAECAPKGVRVMGFYPGKIASDMYQSAGIERDLEMAMTPEQGAAMIIRMLEDEDMVWSQVSGRAIRDYV
ncbi:MAG: SDR family NAD(P)-dependent oxidoreductase [Rhizobiaceae bacterium]|nr:SDR family NAD(P)-dependent oxidoreductase [Rhizobiaceae bacterium]